MKNRKAHVGLACVQKKGFEGKKTFKFNWEFRNNKAQLHKLEQSVFLLV